MPRIFVQNAVGENIDRSLRKPLLLKEVRPYVTDDFFNQLKKVYPDGNCWLWGLRKGPDNERNWNKIQPGTEVAVIAPGGIQLFMIATIRSHNKELAKYVWRKNQGNQKKPFELTYFSQRPLPVKLSLSDYNKVTGYHYVRTPQNAIFLDETRSELLRSALIESAASGTIATIEKIEENSANPLVGPDEVVFGHADPPPIVPFTSPDEATHTPHQGPPNMMEWLKNSERRSNNHKKLVKRIADKAAGHAIGKSRALDLIVDEKVLIEAKTVENDALFRARAALAQLYYYRFMYRHRVPEASLLGVFETKPVHKGEDLSEFLDRCNVGVAWLNGSSFGGTSLAKTIVPWLFA